MEAHSTGPQFLYDQVKQQLRLQTDRPTAMREAIYACRKGGSGVHASGSSPALVDKFPLGAVMNKGLHAARRPAARAALHPDDAGPHRDGRAAHPPPRDPPDAAGRRPDGLRMFKQKEDGCVRAVFRP